MLPIKTAGGGATLTFTDYVENKTGVEGYLFLQASLAREEKFQDGGKFKFEISVEGGQSTEEEIELKPKKALEEELFRKWSAKSTSQDGSIKKDEVAWRLRINHKKTDLKNVIIEDSITVLKNKNQVEEEIRFIRDSFVLSEVQYNEYGEVITIFQQRRIPESDIVFSDDGKSFIYEMGDVGRKQYLLSYKTNYFEGCNLKLKNRAVMSGSEGLKESISEFMEFEAEADLSHYSSNRINVIKIDAQTGQKLKDAVFEIVNQRDPTDKLILVTDDKGEAISEELEIGEYYIVTEIKAPEGYILNSMPQLVKIEADGVILTCENVAEKRNINISKRWNGKREPSAEITLLADGVEVEKVVLTEEKLWNHTFENLSTYTEDGRKIIYTVKETPIEGYDSSITGNMDDGFEITNIHRNELPPFFDLEKTDVRVKKSWIGPPLDYAKVILYANKVEVDTVVLDEGNQWEYVFSNLPLTTKTAISTESPIVYSVDEIHVSGYTKEIVKKGENDFEIINKKVELNPGIVPEGEQKINIFVKKLWVGKPRNKATILLYANGVEVGMREITQDEDWMYTFKGLDKYASSGEEIIYSVKEIELQGYEVMIQGDQNQGFTVVNTLKSDFDSKPEKPSLSEDPPKDPEDPPKDPEDPPKDPEDPPKNPEDPPQRTEIPKTGVRDEVQLYNIILIFFLILNSCYLTYIVIKRLNMQKTK